MEIDDLNVASICISSMNLMLFQNFKAHLFIFGLYSDLLPFFFSSQFLSTVGGFGLLSAMYVTNIAMFILNHTSVIGTLIFY